MVKNSFIQYNKQILKASPQFRKPLAGQRAKKIYLEMSMALELLILIVWLTWPVKCLEGDRL